MIGLIGNIEIQNEGWLVSIFQINQEDVQDSKQHLLLDNLMDLKIGDYVKYEAKSGKILQIEKIANPTDQSQQVYVGEPQKNFSEILAAIEPPKLLSEVDFSKIQELDKIPKQKYQKRYLDFNTEQSTVSEDQVSSTQNSMSTETEERFDGSDSENEEQVASENFDDDDLIGTFM